MKTLADMERELKQLRTRVNELEGTSAKSAETASVIERGEDVAQKVESKPLESESRP